MGGATGSVRGLLALGPLVLALSVTPLGAGCRTRTEPIAPEPTPSACPAEAPAPDQIPGVPADRQTLAYWLARPDAVRDRDLLSVEEIAQYNRLKGRNGAAGVVAQRDLSTQPTAVQLQEDLATRLRYLRERIDAGEYVGAGGTPLAPADRARFVDTLGAVGTQGASLHVAQSELPLRCGPLDGPLFRAGDTRIDRNACSTIRPQEVVQRLAPWGGPRSGLGDTQQAPLWLVRTRYAIGFLPADAALGAALSPEEAATVLDAPRLRSRDALTLDGGAGRPVRLAKHTLIPAVASAADDRRLLVATAAGLQSVDPAGLPEGSLSPTRRPLSRRALLRTAFGYADTPYGFGGQDGGRDCSRFLLDLFESFDIALPRHSGWQAQAGSWHVDFTASAPDAEKLGALDAAHAQGVVLIYFPGHIMLYLGRDHEGTPMALHSLGEYAEPCPAGGETVRHVGRLVVSSLELGRGSSRRAFIERATRLVVFGATGGAAPPAPKPGQVATPRAPDSAAPLPAPPVPEDCVGDVDHRIFTSPTKPAAGQAVRVIATTSADPGAVRLRVFDPDGNVVHGTPRSLGGPPFTQWTRISKPDPGYYTAVLGNAERVVSCKRFPVRRVPVPPAEADTEQPVWVPHWKWERDTENLWSAFVEQLFDYPPDDGRTWKNLHSLLRDPERNLLFDHLGLGEEARLELVPDCADLPYTLRAYFAWKLRLPYAYRRCSRGKPGRPPSCGEPNTPLGPRGVADEVEAFARFARRGVQRGVHSASGRTHPKDNATDLYPVALTRAALPPGTVYADPYGHVMLLAHWHPQGDGARGEYGILIAAEAQPDGTIGRRRFWRGSFLFDPSTRDVGAGFKRFRPLTYDPAAQAVSAVDNLALSTTRDFERLSSAQYELSEDGFYAGMDALINPRPLDASLRLRSLIDALHESVKRRVIAIDNGEAHMAAEPGRVMRMPSGYEVFETKGPWEDFSTPARDMRMLVSIDTVVKFPAQVAAAPQRYGLADGGKAVQARLTDELQTQLKAVTFGYTGSDGRVKTLSLAELVARSTRLEMAYNPNDCIERRWGADEGSPEMATCGRHAPEAQRARMRSYRAWFRARKRPPRGTR